MMTRELVYQLVREGVRNKEIAKRVHLSPSTIRSMVCRSGWNKLIKADLQEAREAREKNIQMIMKKAGPVLLEDQIRIRQKLDRLIEREIDKALDGTTETQDVVQALERLARALTNTNKVGFRVTGLEPPAVKPSMGGGNMIFNGGMFQSGVKPLGRVEEESIDAASRELPAAEKAKTA